MENNKRSNPYASNNSKYSTHSTLRRLIEGDELDILDVGCNDGYLGKDQIRNNNYYGIDYSASSVKKAMNIYRDAVVIDLNKTLELPWNMKFDAILFPDVLEHVLEPGLVIRYYVDHYLQKGGKVIVSLPNVANWYIRFKLLFGRFDYTETGILDKTHLHLYTFSSAQQLITDSRLATIEVLGGASIFGPVITALPFLRGLLSTNIIIVAKYE